MSCIIILLLLPLLQLLIGVKIIWLFLLIFCVIYHIWTWKIHHFYLQNG
jgi:hypothetical protein